MRLNKLTDQKNLLGEYLDIIENLKNYSQHTVVAYKTDINQFFEFMNNTETIDIEKFIQNLARNNYSKTTLNRKIASLTTFLNWCSREKGITVPETSNLAVLKTDKKLPNIMTSNYINTLLDNIPVSSTKEIRDRAIIEILYSSGLRVSELSNLKLTDIKNNQSIRVFGKGSKTRILPITKQAFKYYKLWLDNRQNISTIK